MTEVHMSRLTALRLSLALLVLAFAAGPAAGAANRNFVAPLNPGEEVADPAVESSATGVAKFQLSADGTELSFRLIVANIENVLMAHIHCGPPGVNGPVAVWLYPDGPPPSLIPGRFQGTLATGTVTDADVVTLPDSPACPGGVSTLDDVLEKMRTGGAYVNVHTTQYPGGEIRGAVR
jgi:hypothetical protein